jgi:hypothetical protein
MGFCEAAFAGSGISGEGYGGREDGWGARFESGR